MTVDAIVARKPDPSQIQRGKVLAAIRRCPAKIVQSLSALQTPATFALSARACTCAPRLNNLLKREYTPRAALLTVFSLLSALECRANVSLTYLDQHTSQYTQELIDLVNIPSISSLPGRWLDNCVYTSKAAQACMSFVPPPLQTSQESAVDTRRAP